MKKQKLLALILALCLMFGVLAPAASAIHVAGENVKNVIQGENATTGYRWLDKLLISAGDTLGLNNTLRGEKPNYELNLVDGKWIATTTNGLKVELQDSQLPSHIQALKKLASDIQPMEKVVAFVTLEGAATADQYADIQDVPASLVENMTAKQNALISMIESNVLGGKELTVLSQFTHLTNSIVVETEFANLEAIAAIKGVKSVFLSPTYEAAKTETADPATESASVMTGVAQVWQELGYTGAGMTIAILDTGLDVDHPAFAAAPEGAAWTVAWLQEMLDNNDLQLEALYKYKYGVDVTAADLYYSAKIPLTFDYARGIVSVVHSNDNLGDHGTHVAGIAAANRVDNSTASGMAPDAQLIGMKVFSPQGGASLLTVIKALEDCMILGVDVANLSLGTASGFSESDDEEINNIFRRISESNLIVDVAAGNEGTSSYASKYGYNMQLTDHIENGTIASPSTYPNSMSVGSVDNNLIPSDCYELADGTKIAYMYSIEYIYGYITYTISSLKGYGTMEYYVVDGLGEPEDFYDENGNSLVAGKVAVIPRGTISFNAKIVNAEAAGAIGVLIWNSDDSDVFTFGMTTADNAGNIPGIPVGLITLSDGQKMADMESKTMFIPNEPYFRVDSMGGQMSSFSCWGTTSDLRLMPDISGIGGSVFSTVDGGYYGVMSGTSMASPQVAGVTALVLQYLKGEFPDATQAEIRVLVDSLLMSTATTVIDATSGVEASPRQQGAGLVNALNAISAEAYLTVEGSARPKAELKDNAEGKFSFTFTVHNFSNEEKTYNLRASLLAEDVMVSMGLYFLAEHDRALDASAVTFTRDTVTVAAGGSEEITVTIELTEADKLWIDTYFPNGNYVEGYVYLEGEDEVTLSVPFMGFYGEWDEAPLFDTGFWYDDGMWLEDYYITANQYDHLLFTSLGQSAYDWVLGMNAYTGPTYVYDEYGWPHVYYDQKNNVISPNGDGVVDNIADMYLSLMRNAKEMEIVYTDANGNVLDYRYFTNESKTMYYSNYGQTVPFVYSWTYGDVYDFAGLEDGDVVYLTISGVIDYEGAETDYLVENMPIYIDTTAPVLDVNSIVESTDENGNYVTLTFAEEHPAAVITMNASGSQIYNYYSDLDMIDNGDGTYTVTLDVTNLGNQFAITIGDYGCNESSYSLTYSLVDNNPEMDDNALYAYQVYNEYLYYYYGWDAMFGWNTIDKITAESTMISSDAYESYAIAAAEYADQYVFAIDANGNLLYMVPGVWSRNIINNLGITANDMAFDATTGTMYVAGSDKESGIYGLFTVDLLTGEMTMLKNYGGQYYMPWAMTFVDGQLYCTKYYYGGIYQVDLEGGTYALNSVTYADGTNVAIKTSTGSNVRPYYAQSMTYSEADGLIYWAYYSGESCELITINPTDWSNTATAMYYDQEFVGVLTLEDTGYTLPESNDVVKVVISDQQIILGTGKTYALSATALPWNAPEALRQITWSSSDENVAIVDQNGVVTTVGEGIAQVTAFCNGFEASCEVVVVDMSGTLHAYKYYDASGAYGYWLDIDVVTNTEKPSVACPIDFIAADYNGHTGLIYGYDEVGQCYWFNPTTGEYGTLGTANAAMVPADMAYDYSTGTMYVIDYNENMWQSTLFTLNMATGKLVEVATVADIYITLACNDQGLLYAISYDGILYELHLMADDGGMGGGGIMPMSTGATSYMIYPNYVMQLPVSGIYYAQTMAYDHNNDAILWLNVETSSLFWIGGLTDYNPYAISLGDPSGTGQIQYTGAYVIPEDIQPLPYIPVESVQADDVMALIGATVAPSVNVYPANATHGYVTEWYSVNPEIAFVNEYDQIVGVSEGTTTIYATIVDIDEAGNEYWYDVPFTVTVKQSTDNIYGYLIGDLANGDGNYWATLDDAATDYTGISYAYYDGAYMVVYSAEYVDGMVYAYGFNPDDWNANFIFMVIDPRSWSVVDAYDMGDGFPFVYDMAFDYTTGTMYAVAGPNDSNTELYYVNMANGELIEAMKLDPMIMSLAVDANGTLYGMAASEEFFDPMTWESGYSNAILYTLDPANGTYEVFMDTGVQCNMLASMAYDYDTGYIYWTCLFRGMTTEGGLYLIDLNDMAAYNLGAIGAAGAQVTGLMIIADEYPEMPDRLSNMVLTSTMNEMAQGDTLALEIFMAPFGLDVELTWTSSDENVATVDENGVITAMNPGIAVITVSAFDGVVTKTSSCTVRVYGSEDYYVSYDQNNGAFVTISRPHGEMTVYPDAETSEKVTAMATVNGVIYAYDAANGLFTTSAATGFDREYLGYASVTLEENYTEIVDGYYKYEYYYEFGFTVRDMTWDAANGRMLAIGCYYVNKHVTMTYPDGTLYQYVDNLELSGGCRLYEVNLQTGELEELAVIYSEYGDPYSGVTAMAMTPNGLYIYSTYMDFISLLDLETGIATDITTFQNLGVYGESFTSMAMTYDENNEAITILFTQNGKKYFLYSFNLETTMLTMVSDLGTITLGGLVANEPHACSYDTVVWETEDGFVKHACVCGAAVVIHLGHETSILETAESTCALAGYVIYYCGECGVLHTEFLALADHNYQQTDSLDATCDEDGFINYVCADCGHAHTEIMPAIGHNYEAVVTDPTCDQDGYTTYTCTNCGHSYQDHFEDAYGHMYEFVVTHATCTEGGYTTYTCSVCGDTYVGDYTEALGHAYDAVVTEPTCTEGGYTTYTCSVCGDTYVGDYTEALGHAYDAVVTEPTCTEGGYTTHTCSVCGDTYVDNYTEALGHEMGQWETVTNATCTENGEEVAHCQHCDYSETREVVAHGHNYESVVTEPTCTEDGCTTHTCTVCGHSYVDAETEALGHVYVDGVCVNCGESDSPNPPTGNGALAAVMGLMVVAAGCTALVIKRKEF